MGLRSSFSTLGHPVPGLPHTASFLNLLMLGGVRGLDAFCEVYKAYKLLSVTPPSSKIALINRFINDH
jgi:hypothetical protein